MLRIAIGHSADIDQARAVSEAVERAKRQLGAADAKAGILFCTADLDHAAVLAQVDGAFPDTPIIGGAPMAVLNAQGGMRQAHV